MEPTWRPNAYARQDPLGADRLANFGLTFANVVVWLGGVVARAPFGG